MKGCRFSRKDIRGQIRDIRAHLDSLEAYLDKTRKQHRGLNRGNGTYDPIEYQCFQVMLHTALIRGRGLDLSKSYAGADGKGKKFCELQDGTLFNCYED